MAQIPSLLQLCAEKVAKDKTARQFLLRYLKQFTFPNVIINYIQKTYYKSLNFIKFMQSDFRYIKSAKILHSKPKVGENFEFRLKVGDKRSIWISTLGDLGLDMLKLDFSEGEYGLFPFEGGYLIRKEEYSPKIEEFVHFFDAISGEKGLSGTYLSFPIKSYDHIQLFNFYISEYMCDEEWWFKYTRYQGRRELETIKPKNKLPILFYLTEPISFDDVGYLTLTFPSIINNCGNVDVCWYVEHRVKGRIGIAVKQRPLFTRETGISLLRKDKFRAVGNFPVRNYAPEENVDPMIFVRLHCYKCEFSPCYCDYSYVVSNQSQRIIVRALVPGKPRQFMIKYKRRIFKV